MNNTDQVLENAVPQNCGMISLFQCEQKQGSGGPIISEDFPRMVVTVKAGLEDGDIDK